MNLKTQMAADLAQLLFDPDEGADAAVYTPASGSGTPRPCNVIIEHDVLVQLEGYEAGVSTLGTVLEAMFSDVGKPGKNAVFTINDTGMVYSVKGIESCDGITTRMKVVAV